MPANYVLLSQITTSVDVSSVTFSNIPQTGYTDLVIKTSTRGDGSFTRAEFNGDTASNYSSRFVRGNGSSAASSVQTFVIPDVTNQSSFTANTFSNSEMYIPNYSVNGTIKSANTDLVAENNATENYMAFVANRWIGTAPITSIRIFYPGNFFAGSTFSLYGVAALGTTPVIAPKASGGNITNDGTYWYHTFLASGTFTPSQALTCDYLVVAGGGGAGNSSNGAGGGAGGLRSTVTATGGGGSLESALSLTSATAYAVTVGAGGAGSTNGNNSVFSSVTSIGGGYGGNGGAGSAGATGGSGGGVYNYPTFAAGSGTANQGFGGGNGLASPPNYTAGGGGGAGEAGNTDGAGFGGDGVQITAFATPTGTGADSGYYAGGGAGAADAGTRGVGGLGGGGTGGLPQATGGTAGTANTGGGGGGYPNAGGSGIVIVRYTVA
jgi:hypothetical protein